MARLLGFLRTGVVGYDFALMNNHPRREAYDDLNWGVAWMSPSADEQAPAQLPTRRVGPPRLQRPSRRLLWPSLAAARQPPDRSGLGLGLALALALG